MDNKKTAESKENKKKFPGQDSKKIHGGVPQNLKFNKGSKKNPTMNARRSSKGR